MTGKSPSPADNRPKAEHGQETTRETLLLAAAEVYARRGYQRMTMENVLEQAGLSRPTLYKYFSNKHDLVNAALLLQATRLYQTMVTVSPAGVMPLADLVRARLQAYYHWAESNRPLCQQILRDLDDTDSPVVRVRAAVTTSRMPWPPSCTSCSRRSDAGLKAAASSGQTVPDGAIGGDRGCHGLGFGVLHLGLAVFQ